MEDLEQSFYEDTVDYYDDLDVSHEYIESRRKRHKCEMAVEATEENLFWLDFQNLPYQEPTKIDEFDLFGTNNALQTPPQIPTVVDNRLLIEREIEEFITFEYANESVKKEDSMQENSSSTLAIIDGFRQSDKSTTFEQNTNGDECFRDRLHTPPHTTLMTDSEYRHTNSSNSNSSHSVLADITNKQTSRSANNIPLLKSTQSTSILRRVLTSIFNTDYSKNLSLATIKRSNSDDGSGSGGVTEVVKTESDEISEKSNQSAYNNWMQERSQHHSRDYLNIKTEPNNSSQMTLAYSSDYWNRQPSHQTQTHHHTAAMNTSTLINGDNGDSGAVNTGGVHSNPSSIPSSPNQSSSGLVSVSETPTLNNLYMTKMSAASPISATSVSSLSGNNVCFPLFSQDTGSHTSEIIAQRSYHNVTAQANHLNPQPHQINHQEQQHLSQLLAPQFNNRFIPQRFGATPNTFVNANVFPMDSNSDPANATAVSGHSTLSLQNAYPVNDARECVNCGKSLLLSPSITATALPK